MQLYLHSFVKTLNTCSGEQDRFHGHVSESYHDGHPNSERFLRKFANKVMDVKHYYLINSLSASSLLGSHPNFDD